MSCFYILLQSPGLDLDLCNLHNNVRTLTVSICLRHLYISSYIASPANSNTLLECACVDVGTIQGDIRVREPHEADPERQQVFLRRSDASTRRLWFLWDDKYDCGCCGGCQYLEGTIERPEPSYKYQTSRYFSREFTSSSSDDETTFLEPFPTSLTFNDLPSINYLHQVLLANYNFSESPSQISDNITHTSPPQIKLDISDTIEALSQDSEASFYSASSNVHSDEESYESLQDSPQVNEKPPRSKRASRIEGTGSIKSSFTINDNDYVSALDNYKCSMKVLHVFTNSGQSISTPHRSNRTSGLFADTPPTNSRSPWHINEQKERRTPRKQIPRLVLEIPQISHVSMGHLPSVTLNYPDVPFGRYRASQYFSDKSDIDEKTLAFLSVSVNIIGNIGIFVSPPAMKMVDK